MMRPRECEDHCFHDVAVGDVRTGAAGCVPCRGIQWRDIIEIGRKDCLHPHRPALQFLPQPVVHGGLCLLACGIGDGRALQPRIRQSRDRHDGHDVARARLLEHRHQAARQQQRAGNIGSDGLADRQCIMFLHVARQPLRGIVDQDVERPAFIPQPLGEKGHGGRIGHVEQAQLRLAATAEPDRFGKTRQVFGVAACQHDLGALVGQHHGQRRAEAAARTCDDHALALECHARLLFQYVSAALTERAKTAMISAAMTVRKRAVLMSVSCAAKPMSGGPMRKPV